MSTMNATTIPDAFGLDTLPSANATPTTTTPAKTSRKKRQAGPFSRGVHARRLLARHLGDAADRFQLVGLSESSASSVALEWFRLDAEAVDFRFGSPILPIHPNRDSR